MLLLILLFVAQVHGRCKEGRIVNGVSAKNNEAKFVVGVLTTSSVCGGCVLDERTVLTAAHCVEHSTLSKLVVEYGTHELSNSPNTTIPVKELFIHRNWFDKNNPHQFGDIAILKLERPMNCSKIEMLKLQTAELEPAAPMSTYGWGRTTSFIPGSSVGLKHADYLQKTTLFLMPYEERIKILEKYRLDRFDEDLVCANNPQTTICNGDSGGPLVTEQGLLAGITSRVVPGCGVGKINVFTKVSKYYDWIREIQAKN